MHEGCATEPPPPPETKMWLFIIATVFRLTAMAESPGKRGHWLLCSFALWHKAVPLLLLGAHTSCAGMRGSSSATPRGQGWPGDQRVCYHPEQSQTYLTVSHATAKDLHASARLH